MISRRIILLHCLAAGGLAFGVERLAGPPPAEESRRIVIGVADIEDLRAGHRERFGDAPAPAELQALIADATDRELLVREALRRNLHRTDPAIRRRLVENVRFTQAAPPPDPFEAALALGMERADPLVRRRLIQRVERLLTAERLDDPVGDPQLAAYLARHPQEFGAEPRVRFRQVFLDAQRGDALETDADALLARLRAGDREAVREGDAFPLSPGPVSWTHGDLARWLGAEAAASIAALPPGQWSGPVASPYGLHLARVDELSPVSSPSPPDLAAIRGRVRGAVRRQREAAALRSALTELRAGYAIDVAPPQSDGQGW